LQLLLSLLKILYNNIILENHSHDNVKCLPYIFIFFLLILHLKINLFNILTLSVITPSIIIHPNNKRWYTYAVDVGDITMRNICARIRKAHITIDKTIGRYMDCEDATLPLLNDCCIRYYEKCL
jgi:hypothetical protein